MPLMASISGIRGVFGDGLDPATLVRYVDAYGGWIRERSGDNPVVVVGRDARVTGDICSRIVSATLQSVGCSVIDAGLATTPTVEMAVLKEGAAGGIVLSASHNPEQWNALKLLNQKGEFLSPSEGQTVMSRADAGSNSTVSFDQIGEYSSSDYLDYHIQAILDLPFIDPAVIEKRDFRVVVDGVNSVGGFAIPAILTALGLRDENIIRLHCEPTGLFAHNPEPLPAHLGEIMGVVKEKKADLGIVVDPDADRLAFVADGGEFFGEELTQVLAADFLLPINPGPFVTNLSSSRTIEDIAARHGQEVFRSAVGEINVVALMHEKAAVLGGEGNGGVILPDLHCGRDALVGTAMALQYLAEKNTNLSDVKESFPSYSIAKKKLALSDVDPDAVLNKIKDSYHKEKISDIDGVKIDFEDSWVHLRKSNTEPIIRVYAEARTEEGANALADQIISEMI